MEWPPRCEVRVVGGGAHSAAWPQRVRANWHLAQQPALSARLRLLLSSARLPSLSLAPTRSLSLPLPPSFSFPLLLLFRPAPSVSAPPRPPIVPPAVCLPGKQNDPPRHVLSTARAAVPLAPQPGSRPRCQSGAKRTDTLGAAGPQNKAALPSTINTHHLGARSSPAPAAAASPRTASPVHLPHCRPPPRTGFARAAPRVRLAPSSPPPPVGPCRLRHRTRASSVAQLAAKAACLPPACMLLYCVPPLSTRLLPPAPWTLLTSANNSPPPSPPTFSLPPRLGAQPNPLPLSPSSLSQHIYYCLPWHQEYVAFPAPASIPSRR